MCIYHKPLQKTDMRIQRENSNEPVKKKGFDKIKSLRMETTIQEIGEPKI